MDTRPDDVAPRHRPLLMTVLVVYVVALAVALLTPTSVTQANMATWVADLGVDLGFSPLTATVARAEFLSNVAILAPVSALGWVLWPRTTWRDWTAYAFVLAALVELTQGLLLPHREASATDIVANTLGGLIGSAVATVCVTLWRRRAAAQSAPRHSAS